MNIFFLSSCPVEAAKMQCNIHVRKMYGESCNLLLWPFKLNGFQLPNNQKGIEVKPSHINHPCSLWARASWANFEWLLKHTQALAQETEDRYKKIYFYRNYLNFIVNNINETRKSFEKLEFTRFPRCFGDYKDLLVSELDTVQAYRKYYIIAKKSFARWPTVKHVPLWWDDNPILYVDKAFHNGYYNDSIQ